MLAIFTDMKRNITTKCAALILTLLLPTFARAAKPAVKAGFSLEKLQEKYKKTSSVEADFVQEIFQSALNNTKTSKGNFRLAKPNLIRWETLEPEANVSVSDGHTLWYFSPNAKGKGKGQAFQRKHNDLARQPLFKILTGKSELTKEFQLDKVQTDGDVSSVYLKPTKTMGDLGSLMLKVSGKYEITEILIENLSGNRTKLTLQNQVLGAKLPPALFNFKPPAGTEVLKD